MALRAGPGTMRLMCALARGRASRHAASVHRRLMRTAGTWRSDAERGTVASVGQRPQIRRGEIGEILVRHSPLDGLYLQLR